MKTKREQFYRRAPFWVQELAVSYEGWRLKRLRRGGDFPKRLNAAVTRWGWDVDQIEEFQLQKLKELVEHAEKTSPYYNRIFREWGVNARDLKSIADLKRFPFLEKATLRSKTEEVRSAAVSDRDIAVRVHTSGSTGAPIHVGYTIGDLRERFAALYRMFRHFGVDPGTPSARFSGRNIFPDASERAPPWRLNHSDRQLFMSSYHMSDSWLDKYVARLEAHRPEVLDGYPSAISLLAGHVIRRNWEGRVSPKVVSTTSETLTNAQSEIIMQAFQCPVANQYASAEGAPFITGTASGALAINMDTGVFEFMRPGTDQQAEPGEVAELVVTGFSTSAYPLIRYRIGDTVVCGGPGDGAMPCVLDLSGREDDIVATAYRGAVVLHQVFKHARSSIREAQIEQIAVDSFVLRVAPDPSTFSKEDLAPILVEMTERLGPVDIQVELVNQLKREANGKVRTVIALKMSG